MKYKLLKVFSNPFIIWPLIFASFLASGGLGVMVLKGLDFIITK